MDILVTELRIWGVGGKRKDRRHKVMGVMSEPSHRVGLPKELGKSRGQKIK